MWRTSAKLLRALKWAEVCLWVAGFVAVGYCASIEIKAWLAQTEGNHEIDEGTSTTPKVATALQIERELTADAARERALAKARLARTEAGVKTVRSKRLALVQWVKNPARMIWAKHAELNAIARARAGLRRADLGLRVRQDWARSAQGQAFIAARRQPGLEQAADVARQRRTLERKIKRADKRIATATRTFNDLRVAQELGQRSLSVPTRSPDETRFIRDVGRPAREALQQFPIPARQQAVERLNKSLGRTIGRGFIPGL